MKKIIFLIAITMLTTVMVAIASKRIITNNSDSSVTVSRGEENNTIDDDTWKLSDISPELIKTLRSSSEDLASRNIYTGLFSFKKPAGYDTLGVIKRENISRNISPEYIEHNLELITGKESIKGIGIELLKRFKYADIYTMNYGGVLLHRLEGVSEPSNFISNYSNNTTLGSSHTKTFNKTDDSTNIPINIFYRFLPNMLIGMEIAETDSIVPLETNVHLYSNDKSFIFEGIYAGVKEEEVIFMARVLYLCTPSPQEKDKEVSIVSTKVYPFGASSLLFYDELEESITLEDNRKPFLFFKRPIQKEGQLGRIRLYYY